MSIGNQIKLARRATMIEGKFMSQRDLAVMSSLNLATIVAMEKGKNVGIKSIERALKAMNKELKIIDKDDR